jgi:hypothetical protein
MNCCGQDRYDVSTWPSDFLVISCSREIRAIYGQAALFEMFSHHMAQFRRILRRSGVFFAILQTHFVPQQRKARLETQAVQS